MFDVFISLFIKDMLRTSLNWFSTSMTINITILQINFSQTLLRFLKVIKIYNFEKLMSKQVRHVPHTNDSLFIETILRTSLKRFSVRPPFHLISTVLLGYYEFAIGWKLEVLIS